MKLTNKVHPVKKKKSCGNLSLNSKEHPFVKKLTLGEEFTLTIKVTANSLRKPDQWEISEEKVSPNDVIAHVNIESIEHKL